MSSIELVFIRHAESTSNVAGRWQGQGDAPLSARGRRQAEALGRRLAGERFDLVVASDLSRATDTARALGRPVERDRAWRELDVGAWEGLTHAEVAARFGDEVAALQRGEPVRVGGGESWLDLRERALAALDRLRRRLDGGGRAAVVAHGGLVLTLTSALLQIADRRPPPLGRLDNTGVTRVRFDGERVEVRVYNDATHLAPVGAWTASRLVEGDTVVSVICGGEGAVGLDALAARYALGGEGHDLPADVAGAVQAIAARHPGAHVGLLAEGADIAAAAARFLAAPGPTACLAGPDGGCAAPVVVSARGAAIAAWNVPA